MLIIKEIEIHDALGCQFVHLRFPVPSTSTSSSSSQQQHPPTVYVIQGNGGEVSDCPIFHSVTLAVQLICSNQYVSLEALSQLKNIGGGQVRIIFLIPNDVAPASSAKVTGEVVPIDSEDEDDDDNRPCTSQQALQRELRRRQKKEKKKTLKRLQHASANTGQQQQRQRQRQYLKINALRDFGTHPQHLSFSVDDGPESRCTLAYFQSRFGINVEYILPQLDWLYDMSTARVGGAGSRIKNWLELFRTDMDDAIIKWKRNGNLLEQFIQLCLKYDYGRDHLLSKLTTACLLGNIALKVIQKALALKVFRDVRSIFEFITCGEYTVWFLFPPRLSEADEPVGDYVDIDEMITTEDLDFEHLRTCIQLKAANGHKAKRRYIWTDTEDVFQDLLLVAFQLALAFHCKRRVIYIQNLETLEKHQVMELATAAFLQRQAPITERWWSKNYLQRIIDVCHRIRVTAIIEYSCGLPASLLVNANVIKCFQIGDSAVWSMKVMDAVDCESSAACTSDSLATYIEQNLKS